MNKNTVSIAILILSTIIILSIAYANDDTSNEEIQIKITINNTELNATIIDNPTSKDFLSLLPLSLEYNDLYNREKYANLPRKLNENASLREDYDVGLVAYYPPTGDVVIYYNQDNEIIPTGIIELARIEGDNLDVFKDISSGNVTFEVLENK